MSDHAKIVVHPNGADSDLLPARDVLHHVLDFLELLSAAETSRGGEPALTWLLESITSNSPVTARFLGAGADPAVAMTAEAGEAMSILAEGIEAAIDGKNIPDWMLEGAYQTALRFFKRNTQSIGRTEMTLNNNDAPIYVPASKARLAVINLERATLVEERNERDWTHCAHGSIEGFVTRTGTHYNRPAIWIRDRKTGRDIACVFDLSTARRVGAQFTWEKAWGHERVVVEGVLRYGKSGDLEQVTATDVAEVRDVRLDIADFADPTFTDGMTPAEYLDRWRERGRG